MLKSLLRAAGSGALAVVLCVTLGYAQTRPMAPNTSPATTPLSTQDRNFVTTAANINLTEIKLGRMAILQGSSPTVWDLGARMMHDHSSLQNHLAAVAKGVGVTLPTQPIGPSLKLISHLSGLKGAAFNKAYVTAMHQGHMQAVQIFRREAASGQNRMIQGYARVGLPVIENHLHMATADMGTIATGRSTTPSKSHSPKMTLPRRKP